MQDGVAGAISCCRTTISLAALAKLQALASKCPLVDLTLRCAREREAEGLQFQ